MAKLFQKYKIEKTDGSPIDPDGQYFILRLDTDFHARVALLKYAESLNFDDPEFANEIRAWVKEAEAMHNEQMKKR